MNQVKTEATHAMLLFDRVVNLYLSFCGRDLRLQVDVPIFESGVYLFEPLALPLQLCDIIPRGLVGSLEEKQTF